LWLSQRFPEVYANRDEVAAIRENIDNDIHSDLLQRGTGPTRTRGGAKPTRRPPPRRRFGPPRHR
jgi:hypothetical protein